ncbi:MAG: GNAT family N-acetyltransferase [Pyrinomonadaceae bacterium]
MTNITIEAASPGDKASILDLLTDANLPLEGVEHFLTNYFVARKNSGRIVACAGFERHGDTCLLRSVAVLPSLQKTGIGVRIVRSILDEAKQTGVKQIVLLTTTARDFFARRFHFIETNRESYNEVLKASPEWTLPHCSTAVVMKLEMNRYA